MTPAERAAARRTSARVAILDTCVVLNLVASRHMAEILDGWAGRCVVADTVVAETLYVRRGGGGDDAEETDPIDLPPLIAATSLELVTATEEELATFVDMIERLDDGEAMTVALALHRGFAVASDDGRVRRALGGRAPLYSTLDLLRTWVERHEIDPPMVRSVLTDIWQRARYLPGRTHPHRSWWDTMMSES